MFKITLKALFILFISLNYLSAQDTNNTKSECNIEKFKDILNCDLSNVVDVCDEWQRVYVKSFQRINFTKQPNNKFLMYPLKSCKGTFGGIFGMGTSVYASYKWDIKKHEFKVYFSEHSWSGD